MKSQRWNNLHHFLNLSERFHGTIAPEGYVAPARVRRDGGSLIPDWSRCVVRKSSEVEFERFVKIGTFEAPPARRILEYAQHHGPLDLCPHNRPRFHDSRCESARSGGEPIVAWWGYARQFHAVLQIRAAHFDLKAGNTRDWELVIGHRLEPPTQRGWKAALEFERMILSDVVNQLIKFSGTQPILFSGVRDKSASIRYYCPCLFAVLVMRMAAAMVGENIALCQNPKCGRYFDKEGRQRFCPSCRERGVPNLLRQRRFRKRQDQTSEPGGVGERLVPQPTDARKGASACVAYSPGIHHLAR